jgi:hypothetical protein
MKPATIAEGDVSAKGRICVCVASFMTAVFLIQMKMSATTQNHCGSGLARESGESVEADVD